MKILSKNNTVLKLILPMFVIVFSIVIVLTVFIDHDNVKYIFSFLLMIIGGLWIYRIYKNSFNLFYNEENLILINKSKERHIGLSNINKIRFTQNDIRIFGYQFYEYKIDFNNEKGELESRSFFISSINDSLNEFQELIRYKSPKTLFEN